MILIVFVGFTNNELKGTWIGEYDVHPEMELYLPNERVMTLGNFLYSEQGPKYEITIERNGYFVNILSIINSRYNSYKVIALNNDSLQVKNDYYNELNYKTFRRINDALKNNQKIKIAGKKFLFSNYKVTDTIHFKNDSIFESSSYKRSSRWQLIQHNGFQILF